MVRIRTATPADASAFDAVCGTPQASSSPHNERWSSLGTPQSRSIAAETSDGTIVGFIEAQRAGDDIEILMIATHPAARRQGVATHGLESLIDNAKAERVDRIILEVAEDNHPARCLYARHGFVEIARRVGYYRSQDDGTPRPAPSDALLLAVHFASETTE